MPCYHPQPAKKIIDKIGNFQIRSDVMRPCGQCIGCRLEKARQWAMRCMHEASLHEENCFITLTYNNQNLPRDLSVHKRDVQLFFKRLRKKLDGKSIKYYACGEYGDKGGRRMLYGPDALGRPHYHACLFGHVFPDSEVLHAGHYNYFKNHFKQSKDFTLYNSQELADIWGNGFVTIGELTFESAGYVARYCMKKITGEKKAEHYGNKNPEFALISKGIGREWFKKYKTDCYPKDFVTLNGRKMKPPIYYDYLLDKENPKALERIKASREEKKVLMKPKERVRIEKVKHVQTKTLQRSLHNE